MNEHQPGLRERKRAQTRRRLEAAAVELALREGPDQVSVDAISERAEVSARTFFNYFDSKDDAVLGLHRAEGTEELLADHRARLERTDGVAAVVELLMTVLGPSISDPALRDKRMELLKQHPRLLGRHMARMTQMNEQLLSATQEFMAADPAFSGPDVRDAASRADVVLMACIGGIRAAVREWVAADVPSSVEDLERRAALLVNDVLGTSR